MSCWLETLNKLSETLVLSHPYDSARLVDWADVMLICSSIRADITRLWPNSSMMISYIYHVVSSDMTSAGNTSGHKQDVLICSCSFLHSSLWSITYMMFWFGSYQPAPNHQTSWTHPQQTNTHPVQLTWWSVFPLNTYLKLNHTP